MTVIDSLQDASLKRECVDIHTSTAASLPGFGARLRRLRCARGFKQDHVARPAGVDQATVSRWEKGAVKPEEARAKAVLRSLQPDRTDDAALRRLVESSNLLLHLGTDADHLLLAASPKREAEWGRSAASLRWRLPSNPAGTDALGASLACGWSPGPAVYAPALNVLPCFQDTGR